MDRFDIVRMITEIMEERGYLGIFNIGYIRDHIIVDMTIDNHSISKVISIDEVKMCNEPRYMIRLIINDMINQIRLGGTTND